MFVCVYACVNGVWINQKMTKMHLESSALVTISPIQACLYVCMRVYVYVYGLVMYGTYERVYMCMYKLVRFDMYGRVYMYVYGLVMRDVYVKEEPVRIFLCKYECVYA